MLTQKDTKDFKEERGSAPLGVRDGILDVAFKMENKGRSVCKVRGAGKPKIKQHIRGS